MASFSKFPQNPLNLKKFKRNPKNQNLKKLKRSNSNLKSIWAIMSSLFMYISVFYIFNLSPSTLICNTKFWFIISNTLVLILAADFATFSSTKALDSDDVHVIKDNTANNIVEEHVIKDTPSTSTESNAVVSAHEEHEIKDNDATISEADVIVSDEMMTWHDAGGGGEEENPRDSIANAVEGNHEKKRRAICVRSKSGSGAVMAAAEEEEKAVVLRRTSSERNDHCGKQRMEDEKNDELSRMSNEELNTRFEEFIRRFNRQIRLQALRNPQNFENN